MVIIRAELNEDDSSRGSNIFRGTYGELMYLNLKYILMSFVLTISMKINNWGMMCGQSIKAKIRTTMYNHVSEKLTRKDTNLDPGAVSKRRTG